MQTLELINERFARQMRHVLLNFMRRSADITVGSIKIQKYADFERNLPVPSNLNMIQMKPLRGTALFTYDPNLVFLVIDSLFGGDGRYHTRVEGRDFTTTEQRIIQRLLNLTLESYGKSWDPVYPIEFEYVRSEMHTKFASITGSNEVVVVSSFHIEFGATGGDLNICLPYSMIEPVRDLLTRPLQETALEEVDQRWAQQLSRQVRSADIDVVAEFARIPSSIRELMRLKVGDVLPVDVPQTIIASVDGVPLMECGYGVFNGQYALRVHNMFTHDSDSNEAPTMTDKNEPGTGSSPADDWADALAEQSRANPPTQADGLKPQEPQDDWAAAMAEQTAAAPAAAAAPAPAPPPAPAQPAAQPAAQSVFKPLSGTTTGAGTDIDLIMDVPVQLTVELGRTRLTIKNLLQLGQGLGGGTRRPGRRAHGHLRQRLSDRPGRSRGGGRQVRHPPDRHHHAVRAHQPPEQPPLTSGQAIMTESALLRVIIGLVLVVAAILASAWLARRAGLVQRGGGNLLKQVAALPLGARQSVVVIEVDKTWLVVGVSPNQLTTLHTMPAGELPEGASLPASAFAAKLGQALKRR